MKIWPFDHAAEKTRGQRHLRRDLKAALEPFEKIRKAVGDRMDIMVEFHSMWQLLPAIKIARALAPLRHLLARGPDPHGQPRRPQALRRGAPGADLRRPRRSAAAGPSASCWRPARPASSCSTSPGAAACREARKIAAMAEAWHLPVAPHDCTGPVVLAASTHLSLNAPNALVQESVRAFYRTWYRDLVTALPEVGTA